MNVPSTTKRAPTSFPTFAAVWGSTRPAVPRFCSSTSFWICSRSTTRAAGLAASSEIIIRSEEHTSELQSLAYLVCRLLLEKKKKKKSKQLCKKQGCIHLVNTQAM